MNILVSASTDIGTTKSTNQDSLLVTTAQTPQGNIALAVLCDGMGGLAKGELASTTVIERFQQWFCVEFPYMFQMGIDDSKIESVWREMIQQENNRITQYGLSQGYKMGTTITALLLTSTRYYIANVGDTRAYEIKDYVKQLTQDQTVVAKEIREGILTEVQAENDPRRSVLLQCIGVSTSVFPEFFYGETQKDAVYMLCSDGFRHEIREEELYQVLHPSQLTSKEAMQVAERSLIELNKQRHERDNISVISIRTY